MIPVRRCIGCMERKPKPELLRIVKSPFDGIIIDENGKQPGRGAYICKNTACIENAIRRKRIKINLRAEVSESFIEKLQEYINSLE